MTRPFAILFCICALSCAGGAAEFSPARETIYSRSGLFVISGQRLAPARAVYYGIDTNWNTLVPVGRQPGAVATGAAVGQTDSGDNPTVTLGPAYLAASAERIREAIYDQLDINPKHLGTVYITLLRATDPPQDILVTHLRSKRGGVWDYRLEIPDQVPADHLLRALTHVILTEAANRHRQTYLAEVPLWLQEGMVEHLRFTVMKSAFFSQEKKVSITGRLNEEIDVLKRELRGETLYGIEQLSWPGTLKGGPETERMFRLTSHAMVAELLLLRGGPRQLGEMIRLLPQYQNWQFAFLRAFGNSFGTLLDLEKWWSVTSLNLSGVVVKPKPEEEAELVFRTELDLERWNRVTSSYLGFSGANREWSFGETYLRLGEMLVVPVEREDGEDGEIIREEISVPDLLTSMPFSLQRPVIEQLVARLFGLQLHAPKNLVELVRGYRFALEKYLVDVEGTYAVKKTRFSPNISPVVVTHRTLGKLEELDAARERIGDIFRDDIPAPPGQVAASDPGSTLP